ncbi:response regulator transcription factor [Pseudonocardia spinosispora]|uniref:response regulator transcription factor n=1 Tax=Pseudonocardia spinosispora TaxID=103441 RepID=UPI00040330C3
MLIESDDRVAAALRSALHGHDIATDRLRAEGPEVLDHLDDVDVVVHSLGLGDIAGTSICQLVREVSDVPLILLAARFRLSDCVLGLYLGADDYVVEPVDSGELAARISAVDRRRRRGARVRHSQNSPLDLAEGCGAGSRRVVRVDGRPVKLTPKEFRLLSVLNRANGSVCTRNHLMVEVWGRPLPASSRSLDVHVATLRTKLGRSDLVQTVHGVGYRLVAQRAALRYAG